MGSFQVSLQMLFFMQGLIISILLLIWFIPPFAEMKVHDFLQCAYDFFLSKYKNLL